MSSATSIIQVICPNLYSDSNRSTYIELATQLTSSCFFGSNYQLAIALRACHMYSIANINNSTGGKGAGIITSMKEGDLSINFGSISGSSNKDVDLMRTTFGVQLQGLIDAQQAGVTVTGADIVNKLC